MGSSEELVYKKSQQNDHRLFHLAERIGYVLRLLPNVATYQRTWFLAQLRPGQS
jgi:hypothetical protein